MLLSLILIVTPQKKITLTKWPGKAVHAIFLDWIHKINPPLAERLHDESGIKPFTVSSLMPIGEPIRNTTFLSPDKQYYVRFTTFEESLSKLLLKLIYDYPSSELILENCQFAVREVVTDNKQNPWAGRTSYQDLINTYLGTVTLPQKSIDLAFISPTTFRSQEKNVPLPLPGLVFGSLMEKWNAFAPIALNPELKRYAENCLALSQYNLYTCIVNIAGGKQVGFVGKCRFIATNRDPYWLKQINLLAEFAFYSSVGAKTTMGLGQTRRILVD